MITSGAKRKQKEKGILKKRAGATKSTQQPLSSTTTKSPKEGVSPLHIFFAIFPIAAAATIVALKPELQEQVKANWNMANDGKQDGVQETHVSQQTAASAGSDVENVS